MILDFLAIPLSLRDIGPKNRSIVDTIHGSIDQVDNWIFNKAKIFVLGADQALDFDGDGEKSTAD